MCELLLACVFTFKCDENNKRTSFRGKGRKRNVWSQTQHGCIPNGLGLGGCTFILVLGNINLLYLKNM